MFVFSDRPFLQLEFYRQKPLRTFQLAGQNLALASKLHARVLAAFRLTAG
jgi:hypothetical protein